MKYKVIFKPGGRYEFVSEFPSVGYVLDAILDLWRACPDEVDIDPEGETMDRVYADVGRLLQDRGPSEICITPGRLYVEAEREISQQKARQMTCEEGKRIGELFVQGFTSALEEDAEVEQESLPNTAKEWVAGMKRKMAESLAELDAEAAGKREPCKVVTPKGTTVYYGNRAACEAYVEHMEEKGCVEWLGRLTVERREPSESVTAVEKEELI